MNSTKIKEFAIVVLAVIIGILVYSLLPSFAKPGVGGGVTNFGGGITLDSLAVTGDSALTGALAVTGTTAVTTLTQGGGVRATTTLATSATLVATDFDTENVIAVTPGGASLTLTLPASSTLPLSTTAGSMRQVVIKNATTTAGILITLAGGTGTTLRSASSTAIITSDTSGEKYGIITFVRESSSDIDALLTTFNN